MEQENKTMKVLGGIIGLTQQPDALNRFCLTAPVLSSLGEEFLEPFVAIGSDHAMEQENKNESVRRNHRFDTTT